MNAKEAWAYNTEMVRRVKCIKTEPCPSGRGFYAWREQDGIDGWGKTREDAVLDLLDKENA